MVKVCAWLVIAAFWLPAIGDKVDNEEYKAWASFDVGAWCKLKMESGAAGVKTGMEMTHKLVEKSDEKLVLETTMVLVMADKKQEHPAQKKEIPAKVDKSETEGEAEGMKPEMKEGDEEIEVGGKKLKCHWVETTTEMEGTKTVSKTWTCKDVPGGTVKMETKAMGAKGEVMSEMSTVLVEYGTK